MPMLSLLIFACGLSPEAGPSGDTDPSSDDGSDSEHRDTNTDLPLSSAYTMVTLNLHCLKVDGTAFTDNDARLDAVASTMAVEGVDAVAVQEACVVPGHDAMAELRHRLELHTGESWSSAWQYTHTAWEGTEDEADEGIGVLVRGGLGPSEPLVYAAQSQLVRAALIAHPLAGPTVISVHLDHAESAVREDQGRQTASVALAAAGGPDVVVAGDFNTTAGEPAHAAIAALGFVDASADLDAGRIDHVFVHRGSQWEVVSSRLLFTGDDTVSDHPGVWVRFERRDPPPVPLTTITVHADVGFGHVVTLRGDTAVLSWERGWTGWPAADDRWELVFSELQGSFACKALVDDTNWQTGADAMGLGGQSLEITPIFP